MTKKQAIALLNIRIPMAQDALQKARVAYGDSSDYAQQHEARLMQMEMYLGHYEYQKAAESLADYR